MASTFFNSGGDDTFSSNLSVFVGGVAGTVSVVSDFVHGGHQRSLAPAVNNSNHILSVSSVAADSGTRVSFYIYLNVGSSANAPIFNLQTSLAVDIIKLRLTSSNVLQLITGSGTQLGSNGATLSTGTWYRISIAYTITSTTVNEFRVFVNGTQSITASNVTLATTGSVQVTFGFDGKNGNLDIRLSDMYADQNNSLTDIASDVWVTTKRPNANGTTNGFTTQIGSGGSGYGSGHSPQVNERPISVTNGWSIINAGSAITEEYNVESASSGDINISGATILDYVGWIYAKALTSESGSIIVNNATQSITITTVAAFFGKIAGSTTYPAGTGTDIGMITDNTITTVSLYECGIMIAYNPSVTATTKKLAILGVG